MVLTMAVTTAKVCSNCGEQLREGAEFCTKCGYSPSLDYSAVSDIPFIALAPIEEIPIAKRIGRVLRLLLVTVATVAVCLFAIGVSVSITTSTGKNPYVEVDDKVYESAMELVNQIRSDAIDTVIEDIVKNEGDAKDYDIVGEYTAKFNELITESSSLEERYYVHCAYFTWYTEYYARRYEYLAEHGGIYKFRYQEKAANYRTYADWCYSALKTSKSIPELQSIIVYLQEREIVNEGFTVS